MYHACMHCNSLGWSSGDTIAPTVTLCALKYAMNAASYQPMHFDT